MEKTSETLATVGDIKIPKKLGTIADRLYKLKQRRQELMAKVAELKREEIVLTEHLKTVLPNQEDASGIAGKTARVSLVSKDVPSVSDWGAFYKYVAETSQFAFLQKRLSVPAIKEVWEDGKEIPGVVSIPVVTISINKL